MLLLLLLLLLDMQTADILRAAIILALRNRLKQYEGIDADVSCDGWGLLEGRFRGMSIVGQQWVTPLGLTARRLEVRLDGTWPLHSVFCVEACFASQIV